MKRTRRTKGFIVHIGQSRSAGFWAVIKSRDNGSLHFGYGLSFLSPGVPKIGHEVEFTRLPPADRGGLDRAIEIAVIRDKTRGRPDRSRASGWCDPIGIAIGGARTRDRRVATMTRARSALMGPTPSAVEVRELRV